MQRFTHFTCIGGHDMSSDPCTLTSQSSLRELEWILNSTVLQLYPYQSGLRCWLVIENMDPAVVERLLQHHAPCIKGLLFRVTLREWLCDKDRRVALFLDSMSTAYRERGISVGLMVDTTVLPRETLTMRWLHYYPTLDVVILTGRRGWDPYGLSTYFTYQLLMTLGLPSQLMVLPFTLGYPAPLDKMNVRGWLVGYSERDLYKMYLPPASLCQ